MRRKRDREVRKGRRRCVRWKEKERRKEEGGEARRSERPEKSGERR